MITGELRNKIDRLWETFWTGGITNPLDVVEQMTYLMFIHDLDETDNLRAKESAMLGLPHQSIFAGEVQVGDHTVAGEQLKWSRFHDFPAGQMYAVVQELVFPFIKGLHTDKDSAYAKYMGDAIFKIPTPLMLEKIVTVTGDGALEPKNMLVRIGTSFADVVKAAGGIKTLQDAEDFINLGAERLGTSRIVKLAIALEQQREDDTPEGVY